ncbi:MAG: DUF433 domain-containing protein [Chloroflexota bacterium]
MEPERTDTNDRIVIDPAILAGKPVIAGTRIPVSLILNLLGHGYSFERIIEAYPNLTKADIGAAVSFASDLVDRERTIALAE